MPEKPSPLAQLKQIPDFAPLSEVDLRALAEAMTLQTFKNQQFILLAGDPAAHTFWLVQGRVSLYQSGFDGRQQMIHCLRLYENFNLAAMLTPTVVAQKVDVRADSDGVLLRISRDALRALLQQMPEMRFIFLELLALRLMHMANLVEKLSLHTVRGRLAQFLIEQADRKIPAAMTQDEIAAMIGTVRDVVGRTLRDFEARALIRREQQRVILLNREALQKEAEK